MNLPKIAQHLRTLHFYAQHAHHVTKGVTFMQDHKHFGSLYEAYADAYDTVIETALGNKTKVDEFALAIAAAEHARKCAESDGTSHVKMFQTLFRVRDSSWRVVVQSPCAFSQRVRGLRCGARGLRCVPQHRQPGRAVRRAATRRRVHRKAATGSPTRSPRP